MFIFRAASLTEEFYNKQLLMQNVLAIFGFCTLLYVISTVSTALLRYSPTFKSFLKLTVPTEISYLSAAVGIILLQPFFQCWICQNFTIEVCKNQIQMYSWRRLCDTVRKQSQGRALRNLKHFHFDALKTIYFVVF